MTFRGGREVIDKEVLSSDGATTADALAAREAAGGGGNGAGGLMNIGADVMKVAEVFGIEKKEIGRMLLKSALTGKLEFPGMKTETAKRKKLEVVVDQVIKIAWTMFGIFMLFQVFLVVVGVLT